MKKLAIASIALLAVGVLYASLNKPAARAQTVTGMRGQGFGRQQMVAQKAKILNMNEADLQNELAKGKTFYQIAQEKGVSTDSLHEEMEAFQKTRLQGMVDQGVITKDEMQQRLDFMETRQANCGNNTPGTGYGRGMGLHR